jgi:hypothetical protein
MVAADSFPPSLFVAASLLVLGVGCCCIQIQTVFGGRHYCPRDRKRSSGSDTNERLFIYSPRIPKATVLKGKKEICLTKPSGAHFII